MAKQTLTTIKDEHFGIARKIVSNMTTESWETIPHCAATYDAEVTKFMQVLKEINSTIPKEEKITVNTAMMRVIVEAIKACPEINSHIYFNRKLVRGEVKTFKEINISMPTVLHNGEMMTLNIHDMEKKTMSEMRDTIKETIRRANNTDLNEVMYEVSLDNTLTGLKQGKIAQTVCRLIGSKTGKHKVKTLKGEAKKKYVRKFLEGKGYRLDIDTVDALIEVTVREMQQEAFEIVAVPELPEAAEEDTEPEE